MLEAPSPPNIPVLEAPKAGGAAAVAAGAPKLDPNPPKAGAGVVCPKALGALVVAEEPKPLER